MESEVRFQPKNIFLEIGLNKEFYNGPIILNGKFNCPPDTMYLGVDIDEPSISSVQQLVKNKEGKLLVADAKSLPLRSGTVKRLYMANLLGSGVSQRIDFLKEARRVLKIDGELVIFENITPHIAELPESREGSVNSYIDEELLSSGFGRMERLTNQNPKWQQTLEKFGIVDESNKPDSFILLAFPASNEEIEEIRKNQKKPRAILRKK